MITTSFPRTVNSLLEIDHVLVCLPQPPAVDWLQGAGLRCDSPRLQHMERGTASQLLFFENIYLEFAWVEDELLAETYAQRTGIDFYGRSLWRETQASPFAFGLRQRRDRSVQDRSQLQQVWDAPNQAEMAFSFSSQNLANQSEPLCFVIPEELSLTRLMGAFNERFQALVNHDVGMQRLTQAEVSLQLGQARGVRSAQSSSLELLQQEGLVNLRFGSQPFLELVFDAHRQGRCLDLQAIDVPVVLKY
jgi:hypothetical protein